VGGGVGNAGGTGRIPEHVAGGAVVGDAVAVEHVAGGAVVGDAVAVEHGAGGAVVGDAVVGSSLVNCNFILVLLTVINFFPAGDAPVGERAHRLLCLQFFAQRFCNSVTFLWTFTNLFSQLLHMAPSSICMHLPIFQKKSLQILVPTSMRMN
jgi:hypothetical protein